LFESKFRSPRRGEFLNKPCYLLVWFSPVEFLPGTWRGRVGPTTMPAKSKSFVQVGMVLVALGVLKIVRQSGRPATGDPSANTPVTGKFHAGLSKIKRPREFFPRHLVLWRTHHRGERMKVKRVQEKKEPPHRTVFQASSQNRRSRSLYSTGKRARTSCRPRRTEGRREPIGALPVLLQKVRQQNRE